MTRILGAVILAVCLGSQLLAQGGPATFIDHEKVAEGGTLATAPNLRVSVNRRSATGESEVHVTETDTFYMLSGRATFVVGGKMIASKETAPGQYRGTGVEGGTTYSLTKGDVIVIPAGTAHWFKDVQEPVEYYVVKVITP